MIYPGKQGAPVANTNLIKSKIPQLVKRQVRFRVWKLALPLRDCDGKHEFDAVSSNRKIVAEIKTASGWTSGGKHPSGKRASAFEQLYFLSLAKADIKLLVITDAEFFEIMKGRTAGIVPADIQLDKCLLPPHLAEIVHSITNEASKEIDRGKKSFRG
jgi:hypothetical protein